MQSRLFWPETKTTAAISPVTSCSPAAGSIVKSSPWLRKACEVEDGAAAGLEEQLFGRRSQISAKISIARLGQPPPRNFSAAITPTAAILLLLCQLPYERLRWDYYIELRTTSDIKFIAALLPSRWRPTPLAGSFARPPAHSTNP